jgi:hypothetical protein
VTVVLELATKPGNRARFAEDGEIALAGVLEVDRSLSFQVYTEPELERMADRLDAEEQIIVDGAVWSGFPELAFYLDEKPRERWSSQVLDTRLYLFSPHGRAPGAEELAEATNGLRRLGPSADPGELVEAGNVADAIEAMRSDATLLRDVFTFGRDFGYVQARKGDGVGFERLEVDW